MSEHRTGGLSVKLLSVGNPKTMKGQSAGYLTGILHLAPVDMSGYQVCPMASAGCAEACLNTAGRGRFQNVQDARIRKTKMFFEDRRTFWDLLIKDIDALLRKADREGLFPAIRLNGTSDIPWENYKFPQYIGAPSASTIFDKYPDVQFYDYTKRPNRKTPSNYHLTFSLSEGNDEVAGQELVRGVNVAVVFHEVPDTFWNTQVIDGDQHDLRFLDPSPAIVGLTAKGKAKHDTTGFVR